MELVRMPSDRVVWENPDGASIRRFYRAGGDLIVETAAGNAYRLVDAPLGQRLSSACGELLWEVVAPFREEVYRWLRPPWGTSQLQEECPQPSETPEPDDPSR